MRVARGTGSINLFIPSYYPFIYSLKFHYIFIMRLDLLDWSCYISFGFIILLWNSIELQLECSYHLYNQLEPELETIGDVGLESLMRHRM